MLSNHDIFPVLPVEDLARARTFYSDVIGMTIKFESESGIGLLSGSSSMLFLHASGQPSREQTAAGFLVPDLPAVVAELRSKNVAFIEYDIPGLKTVDGIAEYDGIKSAWFIDSEGNTIGLAQTISNRHSDAE